MLEQKTSDDLVHFPANEDLSTDEGIARALLENPHGIVNVIDGATYVIDPDFDAKTLGKPPAAVAKMARGLTATKGVVELDEVFDARRAPGSLKNCYGSVSLAEVFEHVKNDPGWGLLTPERVGAAWLVASNPAGEIQQIVEGSDGWDWTVIVKQAPSGWRVYARSADDPTLTMRYPETKNFKNIYSTPELARVGAQILAGQIADNIRVLEGTRRVSEPER